MKAENENPPETAHPFAWVSRIARTRGRRTWQLLQPRGSSFYVVRLSKNPVSLVLVTLAVLLTANGAATAGEPPAVEVFTATDLLLNTGLSPNQGAVSVEVYAIDGVERFEAELSRGLPANTDAAKRMALERLGRLGVAQMQRVRHATLGLSKAMQYGLDRYPAIVLDGQAVVYGVTNVQEALHRYRQWQEATGR